MTTRGIRDDNVPSTTSRSQKLIEHSIQQREKHGIDVTLLRAEHFYYLFERTKTLSESFATLDASRTWLCFWILHSLDILGMLDSVRNLVNTRFTAFLSLCQHPDGGFSGGPQQMAHLAPTYAAVMSLCIIGTPEALAVVDRPRMAQFLRNMKQPDGSFTMHEGGEADLRATYCAVAVSKLLCFEDTILFDKVSEYVKKCQTYEGGLGGEPGNEAHGGYAFCGLAALCLIEQQNSIDLKRLYRWASQRQMEIEGGFQGRTNKLVDGCYSYWVGAIFPLLEQYGSIGCPGLNGSRLTQYILGHCQGTQGGLKDKPEKYPDPYHSCYCLSGLALSQGCEDVHVDPRDSVKPIDVLFNIRTVRREIAGAYFSNKL